ncbi:hypothetical protein KKE26_11920 [bacterium]|nr:hypothetical protein [bacterium]MBU1752823.1 hypothetical protein [bacterium]
MKMFLGIVGVSGVLVLGGANPAFCGTVTVSGTDFVGTFHCEGRLPKF